MTSFTAIKLFALYLLHLMVYVFLRCVQTTFWEINGVNSHLRKSRAGKKYERSAQLLKVWHRSQAKVAIVHHRRHFLTTHCKFVHPDFALQKHITLMTVTESEAIFCVPDQNYDAFDTRKYPFLFDALYRSATYLLIMPTCSLVKLAGTIGDPSAKVIWMHHTGRCGSTAIVQALNILPNTVSVSEPHCLLSLRMSFRLNCFDKKNCNRWLKLDEYQHLFKCATQVLLKSTIRKSEVIFVKAPPMSSLVDAALINRIFPKFIQVFMYRDARAQVTSLYRALHGNDMLFDLTRVLSQRLSLHNWFSICHPLGLLYNFNCDDAHSLNWIYDSKQLERLSLFGEFVLGWATLCHQYQILLQEQKGKPYIAGFKYEHMQGNAEVFLERFFAYVKCDYTDKERSQVLKILELDSQESSYIGREITRAKSLHVTKDMVDEADIYLNHFGLPLWGEQLVLPNTLSFPPAELF